MKCLIISNGSAPSHALLKSHLKLADLVIAVDGAASYLRYFSIVPDVLIGDFDSSDMACAERLKRAGARIISLPREKTKLTARRRSIMRS